MAVDKTLLHGFLKSEKDRCKEFEEKLDRGAYCIIGEEDTSKLVDEYKKAQGALLRLARVIDEYLQAHN